MATDITVNLTQGEFHSGYQLEAYTLLELLSFGGESVVWSAWDERHKRVVAIKILSPGVGRSLDDTTAFERHVRLVTALQHPNIIPIYDFNEIGNFRYMVMRYASSDSLAEMLLAGPIPPEEVLRLAKQVAAGLDYIHSRNVIHRDLKPGNILLDAQKRAYLTDFGLAKRLSEATQKLHTGHGTPPYASPEQLTKFTIKRESDIYSMGIMFYEMFTGVLPWLGEVALAVRQLRFNEELPDLREYNPALPGALTDALRMLTAADANVRPASVLGAFYLVAQSMADVASQSGISIEAPKLDIEQPRFDEEKLLVEDTQQYVEQVMASGNDPDTERFKLRLTDFVLAHSVYGRAEYYGLKLADAHKRFMLWGALTHGREVDYWWETLTDWQARLQLCEQIIASGSETAVKQAVMQLVEEPAATTTIESPRAINRLLELAVNVEDEAFVGKAYAVLTRSVARSRGWRPIGFTAEGDSTLAELVLSGGPQAKRASQLIAQIGSEAAVQVLLNARRGVNGDRVLPALVEIRQTQNSLPRSVPRRMQWRIVSELAQRQLFAEPSKVIRAYLVAAVASALGVGIHTYSTYRVPSFLNSARILNTLGSGLLFGILIGLGIFLTRLIIHRLRVLRLTTRMVAGISLGAATVYFGIVSYHNLFLDAPPEGGLIAIGALLIALGYGIGAGQFRSVAPRVLVSILAVGLSIGLTWQISLRRSVSPILFFEAGRPVQTAFLISATSIVMGLFANLIDLSNEQK